jgi:DNA-binding LacI/PurR family transcriptional regulator
MPRKTSPPPPAAARRVSLKMLAEHLDLSPATVSFVLNNAPGRSIPPATRERVKAAAKKFGYQPSLIARSLQGLKTQTIGILLPELGEGYHSLVLSGAAEVLMQEGYFFFTAHVEWMAFWRLILRWRERSRRLRFRSPDTPFYLE